MSTDDDRCQLCLLETSAWIECPAGEVQSVEIGARIDWPEEEREQTLRAVYPPPTLCASLAKSTHRLRFACLERGEESETKLWLEKKKEISSPVSLADQEKEREGEVDEEGKRERSIRRVGRSEQASEKRRRRKAKRRERQKLSSFFFLSFVRSLASSSLSLQRSARKHARTHAQRSSCCSASPAPRATAAATALSPLLLFLLTAPNFDRRRRRRRRRRHLHLSHTPWQARPPPRGATSQASRGICLTAS